MSSGIARVVSRVGKKAVVIGAGISGLASARALADHFGQVVVLESDQLPDLAIPRPVQRVKEELETTSEQNTEVTSAR